MRYEEDLRFSFVSQKQSLEIGIPQERHRAGEVVLQCPVQVLSKGCDIAFWQKSGKILSGVSVHFFVDAKQAFCKTSNVVIAVSVCPDILDNLDRKSTRLNSSHGYISYAVFCLKKKKI